MKLFAYTLITIVLLSLGGMKPAKASIYKCVANDGSITYSQTECPRNDRTAKVLGKNGGARANVDCAIARPFINQTISDMRDGTSSFELTKKYGGESHISRVASKIINYVYSFKNNDTAVPSRIEDLSMKRCKAGNFGVPTCNTLPAAFINEAGGCLPGKPNSDNTPSLSSASDEND